MSQPRLRPAFRRFALALAAAQLLAYAVAPVIEGATERPSTGASVESGHTKACIPLHAPDACLACQLLVMHAQRPAPVQRACEAVAYLPVDDRGLASKAPRAPPGPKLTRAPPTILA
jgi:hypothetical protein